MAVVEPVGLETPTLGKILRTTLFALVVAGVLLVLFVLPAEYGIDPTGLGAAMGIKGLGSTAEGKAEGGAEASIAQAPSGTALIRDDAPQARHLEIALAPREQMELKLVMKEGETAVFSWHTDGPSIYSDLHADPFGGFAGEDIRYREDASIAVSHGAIHAPFAGNHGWFWRNDNDAPVLVTLDVFGFFGVTKEMRADSPR